MTEYSIVVSEAALGDILDAQEWYSDKRKGLFVDFEFCLEGGMKIF